MSRSEWHHVCPSWIAGPRSAHSKFGGGIILGGIPRVEDRLLEIKKRFPDDYSSGHLFHEVRWDGQYGQYNSPLAISWERLVAGIESGEFPEWSAFTFPAFGIRGVENGAILNDNPEFAEMILRGHLVAIERSSELARRQLGFGHVIWWPAFDSRLHRGPLSEMELDDAWEQLVVFWKSILQRNPDVLVALEYKPSVPGCLDFVPTMWAAIEFCTELNEEVGGTAMVINLEFAHALIGGQTVKEAVQMMVDADLFGGLIHVNSAELAIVNWNEAGTEILSGSPGDDIDWPVGEGGEERWSDQQVAVAILDGLGVTIAAEHDVDPAGEDPLECYARSRANLEEMIAEARRAEA